MSKVCSIQGLSRWFRAHRRQAIDQKNYQSEFEYSYAAESFYFEQSPSAMHRRQGKEESKLHHVRSGNVETESKVITSSHFEQGTSISAIPTRHSEKLGQILEHILPFKFKAQLLTNPEQCTATLVGKQYRCRKNKHGSTDAAYTKLEAIVYCVRRDDFLAIPDLVKKVVESSMCKQHQNTALSKRIHTLRESGLFTSRSV